MRKVIIASLLYVLVSPHAPASAASLVTSPVRNCFNNKTGVGRLVSEKVTKCRKDERLVTVILPSPKKESLIETGKLPPKDNETGSDGGFYIDVTNKMLYGPRIAGLWGTGVSMVGLTGANGKNGASMLSGTSAPDSNIGIEGDFFLNVTTKMIYGPKNDRAGWGIGFSIVGPQGAPGSTGAVGATGATGAAGGYGSYGSFYDTSTVVLTQNIATAIPLGLTAFASGVSIVDGSKITFSSAGKFNISFSSQIVKEDAGDDVISVWLCKGSNGGACTNVPWSNTDMVFSGSNSRNVAAWNFFVEASVNDYYQLMISSGGTTLKTKILSAPAQSSPARPEIPGTILTVNQVG